MAKWSDRVAYDMETERMKKAIQDIIDNNKSRITQDRQDELHGDPADHVWVEMEDEDTTEFRDVFVKPEYSDLFEVLREALDQAQDGKGHERHASSDDQPYTDQPVLTITRAVGLGFPLGQAMKKIQESQRMDTDAAKRELLGAINYLAAAVLFLNE